VAGAGREGRQHAGFERSDSMSYEKLTRSVCENRDCYSELPAAKTGDEAKVRAWRGQMVWTGRKPASHNRPSVRNRQIRQKQKPNLKLAREKSRWCYLPKYMGPLRSRSTSGSWPLLRAGGSSRLRARVSPQHLFCLSEDFHQSAGGFFLHSIGQLRQRALRCASEPGQLQDQGKSYPGQQLPPPRSRCLLRVFYLDVLACAISSQLLKLDPKRILFNSSDRKVPNKKKGPLSLASTRGPAQPILREPSKASILAHHRTTQPLLNNSDVIASSNKA